MNFIKCSSLTLSLCFCSLAMCTLLRDPETSRMKSLSGAGVGSVLLSEAVLLNPGSVVFYTKSGFLYEKSEEVLEDKGSERTDDIKDSNRELLILTDNTSAYKGGFSYFYQNEAAGKRRQFALSLAKNLGKQAGIGLALRHNQEESLVTNSNYTQLIIGGSFIQSNDLSIGFNVVDPQQNESDYFSYRAGFQYNFRDLIAFIVDIGSGDVQNYEEESFSMVGIQLSAFEKVFIRAGRFHDKRLNQKGNSLGFAWTGPKLSIDYSLRSSEFISPTSDGSFIGDRFLDTTIGLSILL